MAPQGPCSSRVLAMGGLVGAMVRRPSDLGHDDSAYALPLSVTQHAVKGPEIGGGMLFAMEAQRSWSAGTRGENPSRSA